MWLGNERDALCESAPSLLKNRGIACTEQRVTSEEQKRTFVTRFKLKEARVPAIAASADHPVGFSAKPPANATTPPTPAAEPEAQ